jgi:CspA family cold shock protein
MTKDRVDGFSSTKGLGFRRSEQRSKDIFLHLCALERASINRIADRQAVTFHIEAVRDSRDQANNLAVA